VGKEVIVFAAAGALGRRGLGQQSWDGLDILRDAVHEEELGCDAEKFHDDT
jgi:hypothetical protein